MINKISILHVFVALNSPYVKSCQLPTKNKKMNTLKSIYSIITIILVELILCVSMFLHVCECVCACVHVSVWYVRTFVCVILFNTIFVLTQT